jgi:hypothetical protein
MVGALNRQEDMVRHLYVTVAATAALIAGGMTAHASCGPSGHSQSVKLPQILLQKSTSPNDGSIVGMWHVNYLVGGSVAFQSFQQWHSDGTEFEFADIPTIPGDICMGVWRQNDRKYSLYHTAWTFDGSGNPNGTMVLTHNDKISRNGDSFAGTFDLKLFDVDGNLKSELAGDTAADRISVP